MLYQFKCEKCNKSFELSITLAEYEAKKYKCPKCNSKKLKQQITPLALSTSRHVTPRGKKTIKG